MAPSSPPTFRRLAALLLLPALLWACGDDSEPAPTGPVGTNNGVNNGGNNGGNNANNNGNNATNNGNNATNNGTVDPTVGHWILVDNIHSTKQNPDLKLERDNYNYQGMHGFHRLFVHLERNGYPYRQITEGALTDEALAPYEVLFINLVSADRPAFTEDEIAAVHRFVEGGGGLFVISDHTNVYYSADRLNPLMTPLGVTITNYGSLDQGPEYAIGNAWIKIRHYADHPITEALQVTSFQTGGTLDTEHGIAFLSDQGFGDFWIEADTNPGFYGNWRLDPDEPSGMLPVISAHSYGQGRVVVVADQNVFGDEWLFAGQNFELVSNTFEWLAGADTDEPPLRERLDPSFYRVGVDLAHGVWNVGTNSCAGYFPFYINFNRTPDVVARGVETFDGSEDALVFTDIRQEMAPETVEQVRGYLRQGKPVIILTDAVNGRPEAWKMVADLIPDFTVEGATGTIAVDALPAAADIETFIGDDEFPVTSPLFDLDGLQMAGHRYPAGVECPRAIELSEPYLHLVTSGLGEPFMQATVDGRTVDLARIIDVDGGKVILFLQDGFWQNETLGWERQAPTSNNEDAHQAQYRFIDWLIAQ